MGIKRYFAIADNTISNSFSDDLSTRQTSANAGKSDILEVYSIYGRSSAESVELSRVLITFDLEDLSLANQPSGSRYFLKLFNARHSESVPTGFTMVTRPISDPWVEGDGLDLITYSDEDESNWLARLPDKIAQTITITANSGNVADYENQSISLFDGENSRFNFYFKTDQEASSQILVGDDVEVDLDGEVPVEKLEEVINARPEFSATREGNVIEVVNTVAGKADSPLSTVFVDPEDQPDLVVTVSGVDYTPWASAGGAYSVVLDDQNQEINFEQSFDTGLEDLEIEITAIVQEWLSADPASLNNNGLGIMLKSEFEDGSKGKSFYTKRFFARDSEFFLRRPVIEARYDDSLKDDSRNLLTASPHKTDAGNTMRAYYQNLEKGVPTALASPPNFALTTDTALTDLVTLSPNNQGDAVLDSPNSDFTENAYVEVKVANTSAFDDHNFANSLIRVAYTDAASQQEEVFDFIGRYNFWNAPSERLDIFPINVSNTLENRIAAAQAITDELNAYPGFSALFAAVASGENFRIYSKIQGNAGQNSSVSIHTVSTSPAQFLEFNETPDHGSFEPFVQDANEAEEGDQPAGNVYDAVENQNAAAYENYRQASPITVLIPNLSNLLEGGATYDKRTRSFRGNTGVTADIIVSSEVTGHTGLYVAEFKIANNISVDTLYKKWWIGNDAVAGLIAGHSGNLPVSVGQWYNKEYSSSGDSVIALQNLKNSYLKDDKVKIKIVSSSRSRAPNVVSVNKGNISSDVLRNCHFSVHRISDGLVVVPYDLEGIRFLTIDGERQVQNEKGFKFRVEKENEHKRSLSKKVSNEDKDPICWR